VNFRNFSNKIKKITISKNTYYSDILKLYFLFNKESYLNWTYTYPYGYQKACFYIIVQDNNM